ncbi:MAG: transporter substrate-binding domain-containing protein, partial [Deltaproteobacteria bacterium]|nr:transporter substrate-binding domain-containing protein [Deltaproteobacteria bacterium]
MVKFSARGRFFGKRAWAELPLLFIVFLSIFIPPLICRASIDNRPLIIATSTGSAPFEFVDEHNRPVGMFVDLWRLWAKKVGVEIKFQPVPWGETLALMKEGRADIHAGLFYSRKRDTYLDYGPELYISDTNIFFRRDILNIDKPDIVNGYRVGVIKGDLAVAFLHRNNPGLRLTLFADNKTLFGAVSNGTVKVFVKDTPIALYYLGRLHLLSAFHYRK